jgi:RHS repeat-associated protein
MEIKQDIHNGTVEFITYIGGDAYSAPIILKSDGTSQNYLYLHRDYLGSIVAITNQNGNVVEKRLFDAWGNITQVQDGAGVDLNVLTILDRGYTGHEHLQGVHLIHMNGRLYDPVIHRFLQPDNFLQDPFYTQNYNRYSYVFNNPLKFTDPSGEIAWTPIIIGAIIGAYSGGTLANGGELNPTKWDWSAKTFVYMIHGAAWGGLSGGVSNGIATSGIAFANTKAIFAGSLINGLGTHIYSNGKTDVTLSFGFSSLNVTTGEFGYLFKKGNSFMETLGYSIGLFANLSDSWAYIKTSYLSDDTLQLQTDGHSQIYNPKDGKTFSWGAMTPEGEYYPREFKYLFKRLNSVTNYKNSTGETFLFRKINIRNINLDSYNEYIKNVGSKGISYRMGVFSPIKSMHCTVAASRALFSAGVFNLPIFRLPILLDFQMRVREYMYLSYSLK